MKKLLFLSSVFLSTCTQLPVVYNKEYNISFYGLLKLIKLHSFNGEKYKEIYNTIKTNPAIELYKPKNEISEQELLTVHTAEYLATLHDSTVVAKVAEVPVLKTIPNFLLQRALLRPLRYAVQGTIDALDLALNYGCAINLGGGFHHAKTGNGEGFCFYSDIALAVNKFQQNNPGKKVMIIDLDIHQDNGHESIFLYNDNVVIYDVYNMDLYPKDNYVKAKIKYRFPLRSTKFIDLLKQHNPGVSKTEIEAFLNKQAEEQPHFSGTVNDESYIALLKEHLDAAIEIEKPDLIVYIARTDILENDPLGFVEVSKEGIIQRDELVIASAIARRIPILMLLAGGYTKESSDVIASSINNIQKKFFNEEKKDS